MFLVVHVSLNRNLLGLCDEVLSEIKGDICTLISD